MDLFLILAICIIYISISIWLYKHIQKIERREIFIIIFWPIYFLYWGIRLLIMILKN